MSRKEKNILIIGAGIAGISAAKEIEEYNHAHGNGLPVRYTLLEASDKIGGRVQSVTSPDGKVMNTGAQWFHRDLRGPENPLLQLAHQYGVRTVRDTMPRNFYHAGQMTRWGGSTNSVKTARQIVDDFSGADVDLEQLFTSRKLSDSLALRTTFGEVETGAPLRDVSAKDVRDLVACNKGDFALRGLGQFIERHAKSICEHIECNKEISLIRWHPKHEGVEVYTKDGSIYHADKCILTVSVGVLKSGNIAFEPPLPTDVRERLSHMHMGNFNKMFITLDSRFRIPVNTNTHMDVHTKGGHDIFYIGKDNGQQLITAFVGGEMAKLCDEDPDKAKELAIRGLAEIWGDKLRSHITGTHVTQWGKDPLVRGGYSRVAVGHHRIRESLAEPIGDKIYLAGEAYGALHPETGRNWATHMTGAYLSGIRAARSALKLELKKANGTAHRYSSMPVHDAAMTL